MTPGIVLDLVLIAMLGSYALTGFRQGLVVSGLSLVGFLGFGALAMAYLPALMRSWAWAVEHEMQSRILLVVGLFALATIGQGVGGFVGRRLRQQVRARPVVTADAVLGALASIAAVAVLIWFVAGGVRGMTNATLAKAIGESRVLQVIDKAVPPTTGQFFAGFRQMLDRSDFPRVFEGLGKEPIIAVDPPSAGLGPAQVAASLESVVKVKGVAQACRQGQEGSGWVVAPGRVVTNAHVVSGLTQATVQVKGVGAALPATIVYFDARRDLAVLAVPQLTAAPLPLGGVLERGADAVVAGFPLDGPLTVDPARVRQRLVATGADIYGQPGTQREIYSLYVKVEPGNSGGPLFDAQGKVVGVIFAKSIDDELTGYALTLAETRTALEAASRSQSPVDTGVCLAGG